jgi:uncharacterized protein (TIGR02246 family)
MDEDLTAPIEDIYAAWAAGDADAFVVPYLPGATATLPGTFLADREAIRAAMAAAFAGPLAGSKAVYALETARLLGDSVAVLTGTDAIVPAGAHTPGPTSRTTWVLARRADRWYVAAYHASREE